MENSTTKISANDLTPFVPTHPGEILKDEIEFLGVSQRQLAEKMGMRYTILNEILNGHRPLTERTALMFEAALGMDAEPLLRLQSHYNLQTIRKDSSFMAQIAKIRRVAAVL
ncbi:MAG: HigA family addiction module antidote protein [Bacteroidales bacterium]|nr:HigA family addiction module antidote protein [Bacteroidales bacterium]